MPDNTVLCRPGVWGLFSVFPAAAKVFFAEGLPLHDAAQAIFLVAVISY